MQVEGISSTALSAAGDGRARGVAGAEWWCGPRPHRFEEGEMKSLSELGAEEGEHEVACEVGKRKEFEGVVTAVEFEGASLGPVAAERVKHLAGELGEHSGVVFAIDLSLIHI